MKTGTLSDRQIRAAAEQVARRPLADVPVAERAGVIAATVEKLPTPAGMSAATKAQLVRKALLAAWSAGNEGRRGAAKRTGHGKPNAKEHRPLERSDGTVGPLAVRFAQVASKAENQPRVSIPRHWLQELQVPGYRAFLEERRLKMAQRAPEASTLLTNRCDLAEHLYGELHAWRPDKANAEATFEGLTIRSIRLDRALSATNTSFSVDGDTKRGAMTIRFEGDMKSPNYGLFFRREPGKGTETPMTLGDVHVLGDAISDWLERTVSSKRPGVHADEMIRGSLPRKPAPSLGYDADLEGLRYPPGLWRTLADPIPPPRGR